MLENLTELLLPGLLLTAGAAGLRRKRDVYGDLLAGAQDGLRSRCCGKAGFSTG